MGRGPLPPSRRNSQARGGPMSGSTPSTGTIRTSVRAHPVLASATVVYVAGWFLYGLVNGSELATPYLIEMVALVWLVLALDRRRAFSTFALGGLTVWGFMHMMGGMLTVEGATLYETWLLPFLRWDHMVHAVGFAFGGVAMFEVFIPWMRHPVSPSAAAWTTFMGTAAVGAINETVEFVAAQVLPVANIGDEVNTGLDLVANALGGLVAAMLMRRRCALQSTPGEAH